MQKYTIMEKSILNKIHDNLNIALFDINTSCDKNDTDNILKSVEKSINESLNLIENL